MKRRGTRLVLPAVAVALSLLMTGTSSASSKHRTLTAKPASGLTRGQVIKVTGSAFKPHDAVFLVECLRVAAGQSQCDITTATPAVISAKGVLPSTRFKVVTGKIGNGSCGTTKSNAKNCVIDVGNVAGSDTATVSISFKK